MVKILGICGSPRRKSCYKALETALEAAKNAEEGVEGELVELQGTGEGRPFTIVEQRALVELCAKGIRELQNIQRQVLGG